MAQHNEVGDRGELEVRNYLAKKGFRILAQNYRYLKKEIDIVAVKNNRIHIVEVKTTEFWMHEDPHKMIGRAKIKNLGIAAEAFLEERDIDLEMQFDIAEVKLKPKLEIYYLEDAFQPTKHY